MKTDSQEKLLYEIKELNKKIKSNQDKLKEFNEIQSVVKKEKDQVVVH